MPRVIKANPSGKKEKRTRLRDVKPGQVHRDPSSTFEQALAGEEGFQFWMVVDTQPKKTGRVSVVSSDGKSLLERDDDHEVIVHPSDWAIGDAELV